MSLLDGVILLLVFTLGVVLREIFTARQLLAGAVIVFVGFLIVRLLL